MSIKTGCSLLDFGQPLRKNGKRLPCEVMYDENAKLRELARRFGEYVSQDRCEGCVMKRRCNNGDVEDCWQLTEIRALANELGVKEIT